MGAYSGPISALVTLALILCGSRASPNFVASQQILGLSCADSGNALFEQGILALPWVVESCFASLSFFLTDYRALALGRPLKIKTKPHLRLGAARNASMPL